MVDWRPIVRSRLSSLPLTAAAPSALTDEIAQHLDDQYRELRTSGATHDQAYLETVAELDDIYELHAGVDRSQRMPKHDTVPPGDARRGNYLDDFRRDLRYAVRAMRANPAFVLFVVVTL